MDPSRGTPLVQLEKTRDKCAYYEHTLRSESQTSSTQEASTLLLDSYRCEVRKEVATLLQLPNNEAAKLIKDEDLAKEFCEEIRGKLSF